MFKEKKNILRLAGFLLALIVAVTAFTLGVLQWGHRESGYYDVGYTAEGAAVLYGSGAHMLYYAQGSSSAIRQSLNGVQKAFTDALLYAYRLLDAGQTYEGIANVAALNRALGQPLQVGEDLYAVLADARERTDRGEGYSLFAGALYGEWTALRYLEEPEAADPLMNADEAERLAAIKDMISRTELFHLELTAPDTAALYVSPEYLAFAAEQELETPVLDLNLLHDAYMLSLTARELKKQGVTKGYLYTDSGCSLWLEQQDSRYELYGLAEGEPAAIGTVAWPSPSAFCQFTAFSVQAERYGYYSVSDGTAAHLRHPMISTRTGSPENVLLSAALAGGEEQLVELAYTLAAACMQPDAEGVCACLDALPDGIFSAYTLQAGEPLVYVPEKDAGRVSLAENGIYHIQIRDAH